MKQVVWYRENLRLKCKNTFYPPNLYKGIVWTEAANNKLMYLGVQVLNTDF